MPFKKIGLSVAIRAALKKANLTEPYPIQKQAIPAILKGEDVLGLAKTGSGKTLAFALPLLMLAEKDGELKNRHIHSLILVPTRELAVQIQEVLYEFSLTAEVPVKSMAVYGGVSINPQMKKMSGVQILVATPGRLIELMESKALLLTSLKTLVMDEADKMLNLGFKDELNAIFKMLPNRRQNLLFSATLSEGLDELNRLMLDHPRFIEINEEETDIELIQQTAYAIEKDKKGQLLRYLIKSKNPGQVLIFTSSVYQADHVSDKLKKNGIESRAIHSKKSQGARTKALALFKKGELKIIVATDLLARGIDISFLPMVINYELPRSPKDYVHRIGRTGRAENPGEAISFISLEERPHFNIIQKKMGKWIKLTYTEEMDMTGF